MHYFHNPSSASGDFSPRPPPEIHPWIPPGNCRPQTPNLPTPGKNPVGAHAYRLAYNDEFACDFGSILFAIFIASRRVLAWRSGYRFVLVPKADPVGVQ